MFTNAGQVPARFCNETKATLTTEPPLLYVMLVGLAARRQRRVPSNRISRSIGQVVARVGAIIGDLRKHLQCDLTCHHPGRSREFCAASSNGCGTAGVETFVIASRRVQKNSPSNALARCNCALSNVIGPVYYRRCTSSQQQWRQSGRRDFCYFHLTPLLTIPAHTVHDGRRCLVDAMPICLGIVRDELPDFHLELF
jgi:hypothetical protein